MALKARVAIVTGAANGIGRAIAKALAEAGARVAIVDLADGAEVVAEIEANGGRAAAYRADVSDEAQVQRVVASIAADLGPALILVNNAGLHPDPPTLIQDMTFAFWRKTFAVDVDSMFLFSRAVLPTMVAEGWGRIVNLSSASVYAITPPGGVQYVAAKAAAGALATALASEVGPHGVTVNAVAPSMTRTPGALHLGGEATLDFVVGMQSIKRVMEPEDVAATVAFLVSDAAEMITGQVIHVDGGSTRVN